MANPDPIYAFGELQKLDNQLRAFENSRQSLTAQCQKRFGKPFCEVSIDEMRDWYREMKLALLDYLEQGNK